MIWTSDAILAATGGTLIGPKFGATAVSIDSRRLAQGALFVAFKGERVDGHDFLKDALAHGAAAALVEYVPADAAGLLPMVRVPSVPEALEALARAARARAKGRIIAVTGSVGKTGTKEAIRMAAGASGSVFATQGNLNNHIGLPLSLANMPEDAAFGVLELGMNHAGELSALTRLARPHVAVITTVEAAHLEFFSGVEAIADAKSEIMEGLEPGGSAVLNRDNPHYARMLAHAQRLGAGNILTFGEHEEASCRLLRYELEPPNAKLEAMVMGMPITYRIGATGRHWALASLAALAAVLAAGGDLANAAAALEHFHEPDGRGRMQRVALASGPITLIDDCYNANPVSVTAALAKLRELKQATGARRSIAVLGDMLELGPTAPQLHAGLAAALAAQGIDRLFTAGPLMRELYDAAPPAMRGAHAPDASALAQMLAGALQPEDVVLIKGSRGSRMDRVRDRLLDDAREHSARNAVNAL